jgi:hypothetical protein
MGGIDMSEFVVGYNILYHIDAITKMNVSYRLKIELPDNIAEDEINRAIRDKIVELYPGCSIDGWWIIKGLKSDRFKVGDRIMHYKYGAGTILGNYHRRGAIWYWHIGYDNGTFGYNSESSMKAVDAV